MRQRSLRWLLIQRMSIVAVLPILVVALIAATVFAPKNLRAFESNQQHIATAFARQAATPFAQAKRSLTWLAKQISVEPTGVPALDTYANASGIFSALYLINAAGQISAHGSAAEHPSQSQLQGQLFQTQDFIRAARRSNAATWSGIYTSPSSQQPSFALALPLSNQGMLVGELDVARQLRPIAELLSQGEQFNLSLFDPSNNLLSNNLPSKNPSSQTTPAQDWAELLRSARLDQPQSSFDYQIGDSAWVGQAYLIPDTHWVAVAGQSLAVATRLRHQTWLRLLLSSLLAIVVTVPVAIWAARTLAKPFQVITAQTQNIAQGQYSASALQTPISELNQLSNDLQLMGQSIQQREQAMQNAANDLQLSQERLLATLNQTPNVSVQWFDSQGQVLLWNHASEQLFAISAEEALGKTLDQLIYSPAQADEFLFMLASISHGGAIGPYENRYRRQDGSNGHLLCTTFSIPGEQGAVQFACMSIDITEQKQAQSLLQTSNQRLEENVSTRTSELTQRNQELRETLTTLQHTQTELLRSEKLASLGAMVAGIAHELNTPIGNGLMAATTLQDHSKQLLSEQQQGSLRRSTLDNFIEQSQTASDILVRNLYRASELINSFKQVAVDQTSEQRRVFRLVELCNEIILTLNPTLRKTPYKVEIEIPGLLWMDSYPGPLGQILVNLITNAIAHAFAGCTHGTILIKAQLEDSEWLELSISDDGVGIEPENLPRIFDPFFTTRLGQGGNGLGLNIVHNLAFGTLGGSVNVTSTLQVGTRFCLRLPLKAPDRSSEPAANS